MDIPRFEYGYLLITLGMGAVLLLQSWLIRRRRSFLGAIIPLAYGIGFGYLAAMHVVDGLVDWAFAAIGFVGLTCWWVTTRWSPEY